jgi:hypothetical protein
MSRAHTPAIYWAAVRVAVHGPKHGPQAGCVGREMGRGCPVTSGPRWQSEPVSASEPLRSCFSLPSRSVPWVSDLGNGLTSAGALEDQRGRSRPPPSRPPALSGTPPRTGPSYYAPVPGPDHCGARSPAPRTLTPTPRSSGFADDPLVSPAGGSPSPGAPRGRRCHRAVREGCRCVGTFTSGRSGHDATAITSPV